MQGSLRFIVVVDANKTKESCLVYHMVVTGAGDQNDEENNGLVSFMTKQT